MENTARLVADILAHPDWTQASLAKRLGVSQGTISRWLKGTDPEGPNRDGLRAVHAEISGAGGGPATPKPNVSFPPKYQEFAPESSTPLLGQSVTGPNGRFILNGKKINDVFTPPDLIGVEGAYAVQVYGTSMEPKFEAGETVWINPHRPVRSGDYVVAQILTEEENTFESYLKRFVSMTKSTLTLRQLNPGEGEDEVLTFPTDKVFSVHKVVFAAFV